MRRLAPLLGALVVLGAGTGCDDDGGGRAAPATASTAAPDPVSSVVLDATAPAGRVTLDGRVVSAVVLRIGAIDNPNRHGIDLAVGLETADGDRVDVGRVSPFPPDEPATFRLPVAAAAPGPLRAAALVVTLASADAAVPVDRAVRLVVDVAVER